MIVSAIRPGIVQMLDDADDLDQIEAVRRAIESWLLDSAQLQTGLHRGGVGGELNGDAGAVYVYPEITGYFLQWLAWLRARGRTDRQLSARANACQRWLSSWIKHTNPPQTRIDLRAHKLDWRNSALFFFDLAMVLRGLASAAELELINIDKLLIEALVGWLSRLLAPDGMFVAFLATSLQVGPPDRWSTRRGSFLAKAAAGVLTAARVLPQVTTHLRGAAERTLASSVLLATQQPHPEVHPQLYAIEGALAPCSDAVTATCLPLLAQQVERIMRAAMPEGLPSESPSTRGVLRLDAAAQCLRAALLLQTIDGGSSPDPLCSRRMLEAIIRHASPEGSIPFAAIGGRAQQNVWTAMFAEQALTLAGFRSTDSSLQDARRWIV